MFEKVNKYHPDKVADRIAGAIVDYAYGIEENPKIAVEVLIGHSYATVIAESSVTLNESVIKGIVRRIGSELEKIEFVQVPQDARLSRNQQECIKCGDNGVFSAKWNRDYEKATMFSQRLGERFPHDGKYLFDFERKIATICQSNASAGEIFDAMLLPPFVGLIETVTANPLGEWTGGTNTDTGCTNRKLGSDQPYCNPNGLHGKDLSKADVSVSVYLNELSRQLGGVFVKAYCSIGDSEVTFEVDGCEAGREQFENIVVCAREYIKNLGGFEKFAEYGMV